MVRGKTGERGERERETEQKQLITILHIKIQLPILFK
jgi:hypothetical protein